MGARTWRSALLTTAAIGLLASPVAAAQGGAEANRDLAQVRRATAAYHDVAAAEAAGYTMVSECVPGMGYHFARLGPMGPVLSHAGDPLEATDPELLVYAPRPDGTLRLVAVEYGYAAADGEATPSLFGVTFDPPAPEGSGGPPFHTLHAWVWQGNPHGTFAAHNPNVRCD